MRFPQFNAHDLEETAYEIPDGLPRGYRVILLPFKQWQQILVGQWQEAMAPSLSGRDDVTVWEVPALSGLWKMARGFIDGGMRAGIPDIDVRRHTLTSYGDLDVITETLGITSFETIHVFLLDADGEILWRDSGEPDADKAAAFATALAASARAPDAAS